MKNLKLRVLVMVAMGGGFLGVCGNNAYAQRAFPQPEIPPAQIKVVPDCNADGTPCVAYRGVGGDDGEKCFSKTPKTFVICGTKEMVVAGTPPTCNDDKQVQSCWLIKWEPEVEGNCESGDGVVERTTFQEPLKSPGCAQS